LNHTETDIQKMFNTIAPTYDFLNRLLSLRQDVRWRQALAALVPTCAGGSYVDVATGTGDVLVAVRARHPHYGHWSGVDISENMLALAQKKLEAESLSCAKPIFLQASAEALPFADSSVDCLSISFGLRNVIHKEKALEEFFRVIKPGGTLLILEFFTPEGLLSRFFEFYFKRILPRIGALFSDATAYQYLPTSVASFYSPSALFALLDKLQMPVVTQKQFLFGGCRLLACQKYSQSVSFPAAT
jgi:demethylmenaquinone methyltransferase/2-methoxy-6-polyprenyl-1,4-benzoquinol methylase